MYGSALFTDSRSIKAGLRRTDDLDVVFLTDANMKGFTSDVLALLGRGFYTHRGKWGVSIINRRSKEKLMDMHVSMKYASKEKKAIEYPPRYVTGGNSDVKRYTGGTRGDDPRVATVKKLNASAASLFEKQNWRVKKDLYDSAKLNRLALENAEKLLIKQKAGKSKNTKAIRELETSIRKYKTAMYNFSSDTKVMKIRKEAEREYVKKGVVVKRHFTDPQKMKTEAAEAKKYGVDKGAYRTQKKGTSPKRSNSQKSKVRENKTLLGGSNRKPHSQNPFSLNWSRIF